jgi:hypothetical protein
MAVVAYDTFVPTTVDGTTVYVARLRVGSKAQALTIQGTANTQSTSPITYPGEARVSGNKRRIGLRAAHVVLRAQNPPAAGYTAGSYVRVPLLNTAIQQKTYDTVRNPPAVPSVSYSGSALWDIISYTSEYLDGIPPF